MQALSLAWVLPAVGLVWTGFAAIGLRDLTQSEVATSLGRIQALVVMLSIFTVPVGCIWALRTWRRIPGLAVLGRGNRLSGPQGHLISLVIAVLAVLGLLVTDRAGNALTWIAAIAGCHAGLIVSRWVRYAPLNRSFPAAVLSAGAALQATVGWLHVVNPGAPLAPLIVVEGLALAWAAIAATRILAGVEPLTEPSEPAAEPAISMAHAHQNADATVDLISQAPALQSLPEPAVGH